MSFPSAVVISARQKQVRRPARVTSPRAIRCRASPAGAMKSTVDLPQAGHGNAAGIIRQGEQNAAVGLAPAVHALARQMQLHPGAALPNIGDLNMIVCGERLALIGIPQQLGF